MTPWEHLTPHADNAELRWSADYPERMAHLLSADVAVALPGGVGTLSEASLIWAAAQTEPGPAGPVLVGDAWRQVIDLLGRTFVIAADDLTIPTIVDEVGDVVAAVEWTLTAPLGGSGACG